MSERRNYEIWITGYTKSGSACTTGKPSGMFPGCRLNSTPFKGLTTRYREATWEMSKRSWSVQGFAPCVMALLVKDIIFASQVRGEKTRRKYSHCDSSPAWLPFVAWEQWHACNHAGITMRMMNHVLMII
jgi:hypothetical protein